MLIQDGNINVIRLFSHRIEKVRQMGTTISVIGTIATEPKIITTASGTPFCSFRLASDERRYDREQQAWVDGSTNWFSVLCFRGLAVHAEESFDKGDRVVVAGKLRIRKWERDDKSGTAVEIEAEAVGHDVRWGVSRFKKTSGSQVSEDSMPSPPAAPSSDNPSPSTEPRHSEHPVPSTADEQNVNPETTNSQGEVSRDGFTPVAA